MINTSSHVTSLLLCDLWLKASKRGAVLVRKSEERLVGILLPKP